MNSTSIGAMHRNAFDEHWTAEMTTAAYLVALRHCATNRWLEMQLAIWRALSATIANFEGGNACRTEDFLAELTYAAYRVALPYGRRVSFLDFELELYQTVRGAVETAAVASL